LAMNWKIRAEVDEAIMQTMLPELYQIINDLTECARNGKEPTKQTLNDARKWLPAQYSQSFGHKAGNIA